MPRTCCSCSASIQACMGFVLARDIIDGRRPRELCGGCVEDWERALATALRLSPKDDNGSA